MAIAFTPRLYIYVAKWRRENEPLRRSRLSAQYQKAWDATFPPSLWSAEEEQTAGGKIYLKLKDGTRILAYEPVYKRSKPQG